MHNLPRDCHATALTNVWWQLPVTDAEVLLSWNFENTKFHKWHYLPQGSCWIPFNRKIQEQDRKAVIWKTSMYVTLHTLEMYYKVLIWNSIICYVPKSLPMLSYDLTFQEMFSGELSESYNEKFVWLFWLIFPNTLHYKLSCSHAEGRTEANGIWYCWDNLWKHSPSRIK